MLSVVVGANGDPIALARCLASLAEGVMADLVADAACVASGQSDETERAVAEAVGAELVTGTSGWAAGLSAALDCAPRGRTVLWINARFRLSEGWTQRDDVKDWVRRTDPAAAGVATVAGLRDSKRAGPLARTRAATAELLARARQCPLERLQALPAFIAARGDLEDLLAAAGGQSRTAPRLRIVTLKPYALEPAV